MKRLPDFLVVGATKCGTSSIFRYLKQHPDIYMPGLKEINFFLNSGSQTHRRSSAKDLDEYSAYFSPCPAGAVTGEVAPTYLGSPIAAQNISKHLPDSRIIIILRDPVKRSYSAYLMAARNGNAPLDVYEAMSDLKAFYINGSTYYRNVKPFYDLFPRTSISVLLYEDLVADNIAFMSKLYRLLNVDAQFVPDVSTRYNTASLPRFRLINRLITSTFIQKDIIPRLPQSIHKLGVKLRGLISSKPPVLSEDLESMLRAHFAEDVKKTADLIQQDLSHWL